MSFIGKLSVTFLLFNLSLSAYEIESRYSLSEWKNPQALYGVESSGSRSNQSLALSIDGKLLKTRAFKSFTQKIQFQIQKNDYTQLELRDSVNMVRSFPFDDLETQAQLQISYAKGVHSASLVGQKNLNDSPFSLSSLSFDYSYAIFNQTTVLSFAAQYVDQDKPVDHYLDFDFQVKERPTNIETSSFAVSVEQVYGRRSKGRFKLSRIEQKEERPVSYGFEYSQYYAFSDRFFAQMTASYFQDSQNQSLKNERGYFRSASLRTEFSYELNYDWNLNLAYTVSSEREKNERAKSHIQVASDVYELATDYSWNDYKLSLSALFRKTNTIAESIGVSAGFTWEV